MKKLIFGIAAAVAMLFSAQLSAQENYGNVGLEFAIPMGDFSDAGANFGIGGSGLYEYGITENIAALANAGVLFYATDKTEVDGQEIGVNFTQIPIQVGARYYLTQQREGAFAGIKAGVHITIAGMDGYEFMGTKVESTSNSNTNFSFAPEVGYFLNENISVSLKYQIVTAGKVDQEYYDPIDMEMKTKEVDGTSTGYLGIRLAYSF